MKILIIGGGIGGLATAGFLEQKGYDVTLIERAAKFGHIGFGLSIWDETESLLEKLGLNSEIRNKGYMLPWFELRDKRGCAIDYRKYKDPIDRGPIMIERSVLLEAMVKNLRTTKLLLETTVKELKNGKNKVEIELSNGTKEVYNLVIAADGIDSEIRERIFGPGKRHFYGWSVRSFWVPDNLLDLRGAIIVSKEKIGLGIFPVKNKHFVVTYEYNPERVKCSLPVVEDFPSAFGWSKELLAEVTKEAREGREFYGHLSYVPSGNWYKERVVLIGDAAHGFSPVGGYGANMAIEDGYVLAEELAKIEGDNLDLALSNFVKRRSPRLKNVIFTNQYLDQIFFIESIFLINVRDILGHILPVQWIRKTLKRMRKDTI